MNLNLCKNKDLVIQILGETKYFLKVKIEFELIYGLTLQRVSIPKPINIRALLWVVGLNYFFKYVKFSVAATT